MITGVFFFQILLFVQNRIILKETKCENINETSQITETNPETESTQRKEIIEEVYPKEIVQNIESNNVVEELQIDYLEKDDIKRLEDTVEDLRKEISLIRNDVKQLNETYGQLLILQKSTTVDTTVTDTAMEKTRKLAEAQYGDSEFGECYISCKKILTAQPEDIAVRVLKAKALYYKNPLDSSVYEEILNDLEIISKNNIVDKELEQIQRNLLAERGLIYED